MKKVVNFFKNGNLIVQIVIGMVLGILLALISKEAAVSVGILGSIFVGALKAIAPILIFILVIVAIATKPVNVKTDIKPILVMYFAGMFLAAFASVAASFMFPTHLALVDIDPYMSAAAAPVKVQDVIKNVILNMIDNPVHALSSANFIGVLTWGVGIGIALHHGSTKATKEILKDVNHSALKLVRFVISLAPFGIFGIMAETFAATGFSSLLSYGRLLLVLVGTMLFVAFIINPLIMYIKSRRNPYPLLFVCLKESAITAFFTRSSAANTPINLELCKKMGLNQDTYSVSIPLGSVINMSGAAVTVTVFALSTAYTLNIEVSIASALVLCIISALAACGTSGVAGGSLLLIPLACSLFDISGDVAMQVVAIGFLIGVVQDSVETALNSSTDVMFTAAASQNPPNLKLEEID
ncbi:MAG: serine/threonine transporter SstT [Campylobacteraceae bacterium]|jgi:serine/threonine transporter|nr:serine/threonine transporter SstT [Campylobacteraceae bacterium]